MTTKYNNTFPTKKFFVEVFNSNNKMIMKSKEFMDYSMVHKFIDFLELLEDDYTFVIKNINLLKNPSKTPRGNFKRQKNDHHFKNCKYRKPPIGNDDLDDGEIDELLDNLTVNSNNEEGNVVDNYDTNNNWSVLGKSMKYQGCVIKKYGEGYNMKGNESMDFYGQKYLPENRKSNIAWWQSGRKSWFLKKESLQYFLDNGAILEM